MGTRGIVGKVRQVICDISGVAFGILKSSGGCTYVRFSRTKRSLFEDIEVIQPLNPEPDRQTLRYRKSLPPHHLQP